jgi:hypothetical protein
VTISGPITGIPNNTYTFTATVNPLATTIPITYVWKATGQSSVTTTADLTDTVTFNWSTGGAKTITVTAASGGGTVTDTHIINIGVPVTGVVISGPATGAVNKAYTFAATISPLTATAPITYAWSPEPDSGQGTAVVGFTWGITGDQTITVTVENVSGMASNTHVIAIGDEYHIYLPILLR